MLWHMASALTLHSLHRMESQALRSHRVILAKLLKEHGLSHRAIAEAMGWRSAGTVGFKLRGERDWNSGELERMCELAGITVVTLASMSDDLRVTRTDEAAEAAILIDKLPREQRNAAVQLLRSMAMPSTDRKKQ